MNPVFFQGPDPNTVFVRVTAYISVKAIGKEGDLATDVQEWKVEGGKIKSFKAFYGNPCALDALFKK